jgi:hypothetical protein
MRPRAQDAAPLAIVAMEVFGGEDVCLERFIAAKNGTPLVGIGNEELDDMMTRRIGDVIERQHDV